MLDDLIAQLDRLEAPADLEWMSRLLRESGLTRRDLGPHVRFEDDHYARNEVARSAWHELVCVCWRPGQGTPIHDHRASSCAFLVVEGRATEIRFDLDEGGMLAREHPPAIREPGYICSSWDADVHEVVNRSPEDLITLHIYSPALTQVHVYSRDTRRGELWTPHLEPAAD
ncbi:MAG: hypothetical protein D6693_03620 [Planctomycetota bacterium]|nr:MAG: hypothetical protein D6693_03620 [Planctomycetota bacterium]